MLILRRKAGEAIVFNDRVIVVRILAVEGDRVKLGIQAPEDVIVVREELLDEPRPLTLPPQPPQKP